MLCDKLLLRTARSIMHEHLSASAAYVGAYPSCANMRVCTHFLYIILRCARAGVRCLAYLWYEGPHSLVRDMVNDGVEAVIVGVSGGTALTLLAGMMLHG